jgi:hypothetical protein
LWPESAGTLASKRLTQTAQPINFAWAEPFI